MSLNGPADALWDMYRWVVTDGDHSDTGEVSRLEIKRLA